jgi:hypothetical protein
MKKIRKNILLLMLAAFVALTPMLLTSCDDGDETSFGAPTITASPAAVALGEPVEVTIAVAADAGLASIEVDGAEVKTFTTEKTAVFTYEYTGSNSSAIFTVVDKKNKTADVTVEFVAVTPVDAAITGNTTWTKDKRYLLKGNVYVQSPATLTIEAGTVIFGDKVTKGSLIVSRGAKIMAAGSATEPIVFTSSAPRGFRNYGDWGGVVILGKAKNNQSVDQTIEGISAASGDNGKYGGTADDDNSGVLKYVRIEFGGIALSTDNELNGLTMGSVGNATEINHIQVSYSGDDSYEWFGGTVDASYLIAYRGWDDDFDTDFGYSGNVQYGVAFRDPNIADKSGSNGFESDNDGSGTTNAPKTSARFSNITWFGPHVFSKPKSNGSAGAYTASIDKGAASANFQFGGHIRRNTDIQIYNSVFVGSQLEGVHFDKTGQNAVFKGNYFGRTGIGASTPGTVKKVTAGNSYDDANFAADNLNTTDGATQTGALDLSTVFAGLKYNGDVNTKFTNNMSIDQPSALLAAGSSLLTGAVTVPEGLEQTVYIGAFDATTNWATAAWTNYDPNNTSY